jgi:hypothetical protein
MDKNDFISGMWMQNPLKKAEAMLLSCVFVKRFGKI